MAISWVPRAPKWIALCLSAGVFSSAGFAQQASTARAVIDRYCAGCHSDAAKMGGLSLAKLNPDDAGANSETWEKVVRKLLVRYMPPAGVPRPDEATYNALVSTLEASLDRAAAKKPNPGRTDPLRRLNRTEYHNAIRDLLALDVDVASLLPKDDSSHGFDNITVGELSPTLLERYLNAAQKISRLALGSPVRSPGGDVVLVPADLTQEDRMEDLPPGTRGGTLVRYNFPLTGEYEIQLRLTRDRNEHIEGFNEANQVEVAIDGQRVQLFSIKPPARVAENEATDGALHLRTPVTAGPHTIAATFIKKSSALIETERQPYISRFNMDRHPRSQPALYSVSVTGPFNAAAPGNTPSRQRILVCTPKSAAEEDACANRILSNLVRRAYRRPSTPADLEVLQRFYKEGRASGGFEGGVELALRAVLASPQFLFRIEQDPKDGASGSAYRISDFELASRLSFFLWSSIPDDELLDAAARNTLHQPAVLERQVRRMLADSRSEALVNNFAEQWLYLRNLAAVTPDVRLYPDFDDNLRQSMRRETELLFESIMREDRNVLDLLRADYTFLNERLARHYGIPGIYGSRFRRVTLPPDQHRAGLLGQGSILTVTSFANRTSPVVRGKWILANILGTPPPAPPPNVPRLKDHVEGTKAQSMRERVAEHRSNPACSGCHQLMDPAGFSLENFDAVGRWRSNEDGAAIDAEGNLPGGSEFSGPEGLRQAVLSRPELFPTTVTEKLLTYAVGRGLEYYDAPAIRKVVTQASTQDYRFSAVVLGIVNSTPFQMRRVP